MSLIIKATFKSETRRFRLETEAEKTFANLAQTLFSMFGDKQLKFSYTDSDGDVIAFSSENEFRDAVAQRANEAEPLKILVTSSTKDVENNNKNEIQQQQQKPVVGGAPNVWLELPVWVRRRVMARNNLVGDINDAALFDQLPLDARERIHGKFCKKQQADAVNAAAAPVLSQPVVIVDGTKNAVPDVAAAASSTTPVDTEELSAEQVWASMPSWFKNRVVSKFVPHLLPQAEEYAAFVALPEHVKFRVRARHAQFNAKREQKDWRDEKKQHHCGGRFGGGQKFFGGFRHGALHGGPQQPPQDGAVEPHPLMQEGAVAPHPPMHAQPMMMPMRPMHHHHPMMFARGGAPHAAPTAESIEADRAMWNSLPEWVHFKIASKAAHHGMQVSDPHDFAVFQALPVHAQAKVRAKGARGKFQKWSKQ